MSFNKITIIGNLGRDPELRYTTTGIAVCTFTLATNEKRKDASGEAKEVVTWFRVTAWRMMAENISKYLTKGSQVYIEGRLRVDEWQDKEQRDRYTLDVQATECQFLGGGGTQTQAAESASSAPPEEAPAAQDYSGQPVTEPVNDDDIPF